MEFLIDVKDIFPRFYRMTSRMTSRMNTRKAVSKVSLYESDQEDYLNDEDYFPEKVENEEVDNEVDEEVEQDFVQQDYVQQDFVQNTRNRNRTRTKSNVVVSKSKDNETKEQLLVDRKKRDKRLTAVKAEAARSKQVQQSSSLTDIERTQTKRELKKYLLDAKVLQEKIEELDEMLTLDSADRIRWS